MEILTNSKGEKYVDPFSRSAHLQNWKEKITKKDGSFDYYTFKTIPREYSKYLTMYLIDLMEGRNLKKGKRKGPRSPNYIFSNKNRLKRTFELLLEERKCKLLDISEKQVLAVFQKMRDGRILTNQNKRYLETGNYTKLFYTFWHWLMRIKKKANVIVPDIVVDLDISKETKPKWHYFTYDDLKIMVEKAPTLYLKAILLFLFDAGLRPPSELMNVRRKDITEMADSKNLQLNIREETSKTYGRKIKLAISSEMLRKYLNLRKFDPEDFIWDANYKKTTRAIASLGFEVLGIGFATINQKNEEVISDGIVPYHFRHNSVCHYLPIYNSENQLKYRYGWSSARMINYYSEFMGMRDTLKDSDVESDSQEITLNNLSERIKLMEVLLKKICEKMDVT